MRWAYSIPFLNDESVRMLGVEAGGRGIKDGEHAARFQGGKLGVLQGTKTWLLADDDGQIQLTHSISAGLDYAACWSGTRLFARHWASWNIPTQRMTRPWKGFRFFRKPKASFRRWKVLMRLPRY